MTLRLAGICAGVLVFALLGLVPAHAQKRVALVIGNGAYRSLPVLINPRNAAEDVGKALAGLGFATIVVTDLDRPAMNEAVERFARTVAGADIALVYYSGHGMQFQGQNYLLPIDTRLDSAEDVNRFRLMPLDDILDVMRAGSGARVVILDASRDNPVEEDLKRRLAALPGADRNALLTRGLGRISAGNGLVVAYATQANDVAQDGTTRNSPFTAAFLRHAGDDVDLRQMLFRVTDDVDRETQGRQRPELSISLVGEFKLRAPVETKQVATVRVIPPPGPPVTLAALYEEDANDPKGSVAAGTAIWTTEMLPAGTGKPPQLAVRANIEIPGRKINLTWTLRQDTDQDGSTSHIIEIMFKLPPDFPSGGILNVPGILMKQGEQTRGTALKGLAVKVTNGYFMFGLSAKDKLANFQLLKEESWFDIPIVYTDNRRAILAMKKGAAGERAFEQAFAEWEK
jgi:uncharacterized caspase-like protein